MTIAAYRDRTTGAYPIHLETIRAQANILFGDEPPITVLEAQNVEPVLVSEPPSFDPAHAILSEDAPALVDGKWRQQWTLDVIPIPEPLPPVVTRRQAKIVLSRAGLLSQADAAIAAMEGQPGEEARIDWADASTFRRDNPLIAGMASALGLSVDQVDTLFRQAAQIP